MMCCEYLQFYKYLVLLPMSSQAFSLLKTASSMSILLSNYQSLHFYIWMQKLTRIPELI